LRGAVRDNRTHVPLHGTVSETIRDVDVVAFGISEVVSPSRKALVRTAVAASAAI
jgi:hypothetical protein